MIAIIDYNAGNLQNVGNALTKINQPFKIATKPEELKNAEKVILPGVGAAKSAIEALKKTGFDKVIPRLKIPFLGICLGMQLLADFSEEGNTECLKIIPGKVKRFRGQGLKVPQIGWNRVNFIQQSSLTQNIPAENYFYFVNSYYFEAPARNIIGQTDYGITFASIARKDNFYGVQFHPEKSGEAGINLIRNFCEKC